MSIDTLPEVNVRQYVPVRKLVPGQTIRGTAGRLHLIKSIGSGLRRHSTNLYFDDDAFACLSDDASVEVVEP